MASLIKQLAEEMEAKDRRIAELEAAAARPEIRGQSAMQMVIAVTLIARACPTASFREIHDMWAAHADEDAAEQKRKDMANQGGAALASWLGSWIAAGAPQDKCLCACLESGCPTFDKVYVRGRGFVDRWRLAEEAEEREAEEHEEWDCSCATPEMCRGGCEESEIARDLFSSTGVPATNAQIAAVKSERYQLERAAPAPAPLPRKPRTWAQVVAGGEASEEDSWDDEPPCRCYKQRCSECNPEGLVDERH